METIYNYKSFLNEKKQALSKKDKSKKGSIDERIKKLIKVINENRLLFTTSSCSGRILVMKETGKKQKKAILQSWHEKINHNKLINALKKLEKNKIEGMIYFKFEPFILHITCFSHDLAAKIVNSARQCGFKKSGFYYGKREWAIIEIGGSESLSLPIFKNKILVKNNYLKLLVKEANKKLKQNFNKIKRLEKSISEIIRDI